METQEIIYLVAAALILRVIIKVIARYIKEGKQDSTNQDHD